MAQGSSYVYFHFEVLTLSSIFTPYVKVILQSESLKDAFSELDMTSEVLQITMSPNQPYFRCGLSHLFQQFENVLCILQQFVFVLLFRLSTFGNSGNAHYDYPKDSDMMELFRCTKTQTNR